MGLEKTSGGFHWPCLCAHEGVCPRAWLVCVFINGEDSLPGSSDADGHRCTRQFVSVWIRASLNTVRVCVCVCTREGEAERGREKRQTGRKASLEERHPCRKLGNVISVEDTEAPTEVSAKLDKPFNPFIKHACSSAAWAGATRMKYGAEAAIVGLEESNK